MDYQSQYQVRWTFGGRMSPVVKALIWINCIVFILSLLLMKIFDLNLALIFGLVPTLLIQKLFLWQFFTYLFFHGNLMHLLFNMLVLWMLGGEMEDRVFGSRKFLIYYIICGVGAGLFHLAFFYESSIPIIGASGAIYGILVAYAIFFGNRPLILFPFPVFIKAKYFVLMIGLIELVSSVFYTTDGIAHLAHLGGMVVGYFYIMWQLKGPKKMIRDSLRRLSFRKKQKFTIIDGGR